MNKYITMEVKEFIKQTIVQISDAITESQKELESKNVIINPERTAIGHKGDKYLQKAGQRFIQNIDFEIIVTLEEQNKKGGKASINVANVFSIGGDKGISVENINQHKLKFSLPIALPTTKTPSEYIRVSPIS